LPRHMGHVFATFSTFHPEKRVASERRLSNCSSLLLPFRLESFDPFLHSDFALFISRRNRFVCYRERRRAPRFDLTKRRASLHQGSQIASVRRVAALPSFLMSLTIIRFALPIRRLFRDSIHFPDFSDDAARVRKIESPTCELVLLISDSIIFICRRQESRKYTHARFSSFWACIMYANRVEHPRNSAN